MPYIEINQPWVSMCPPSWIPFPLPSPSHPSGSSQCTSPEHPVSCIEPGLEIYFTSVHFSHSVVSDCLWPHEPQHNRPPCPSATPRVHPNPCPLSQWCHTTISSSVIPFSSCPQSFPASGSFQMSQLFASGGQSIGVSASTSGNINLLMLFSQIIPLLPSPTESTTLFFISVSLLLPRI